ALEKATGRPAADVLKNVQAAAPSVATAVEAQAKSPPRANLGASIWAALKAMVGGKPKAEGSTGISTIEFALSVLRHPNNPVEFSEEMHAKHGVSRTVDVPGRGRFMVDDSHDVVVAALSGTDRRDGASTFEKPPLQGHGLAFLMGSKNL